MGKLKAHLPPHRKVRFVVVLRVILPMSVVFALMPTFLLGITLVLTYLLIGLISEQSKPKKAQCSRVPINQPKRSTQLQPRKTSATSPKQLPAAAPKQAVPIPPPTLPASSTFRPFRPDPSSPVEPPPKPPVHVPLDLFTHFPDAPEPAKLSSFRSTTTQRPNRLQGQLLSLLHGDRKAAERLLSNAKARNPELTEDWYFEKVIFDLTRDRH